jgi:hypothetical protein
MNYEQFKHTNTESMKEILNEGELLQLLSGKNVEAASIVEFPNPSPSLKQTLSK